MERGRGRRGNRQLYRLYLGVMEDRGEHAIVRTHETMPVGAQPQCRTRAPDTRVYHSQMHGAGRKSGPGSGKHVGGRPDVSWRYVVGEIDQGSGGGTAEEHALHFSDVGVGGSEVRQEGDNGRSLSSQNWEGHAASSGQPLQLLGDLPQTQGGRTVR